MSEYLDFLRWRDQRQHSSQSNQHSVPLQPVEPAGKEEAVAVPPPKDVVIPMMEVVETKHALPLSVHADKIGDRSMKIDLEASKDARFLKLAQGNTAEPVTFAWRNLTMKVPIKTDGLLMGLGARDTGQTKAILDGVSGYIEPGQLLYIMGPSGAGKSSMLDVLADRVTAEVTGVQYLQGQHKTPYKLKEVSKYVEQHDALLGALTVKETFAAAADFYVADPNRRIELVDAVIEMLGLQNQTNTKIGDVFFRGLSGGQKRRVSIGIELIAQPSMLFLDEPTSGLDSASAFSIMTSIRKYARATNTPVLCTIHQPSELLFELADNLLLLSGGKEAYFGPIRGLEEHFNAMGFQCPPRTSVAEWILDLVNRDFGEDAVVDQCQNGFMKSPAHTALEVKLDQLGVPKEGPPMKEPFLNKLPYKTSQVTTSVALFKRGFTNAMRAPAVIWFRFAMYVMLAILIGTVWLQLGDSSKVITDFNGAMFFTTAFMIFMSISVLPMYLEERSVFVRERANSSYSVFSYLTAHFLFELPFVFIMALVCSCCVYWLVGFWANAEKFFIFTANLFIGLMVAESLMVLISACIPYFIVGIAIGAFTFGAFMCVMGYFVAFSQVGWWWKWLRYLAVHYYNFSTFMTNQHSGRNYTAYCDPTGFPCSLTDVDGTSIVTYYDLEQRIWLNFVVQIIMIFGYRFFAWVYMTVSIRGKK